MESNEKLKEIYIENHACYYFDDITKFEDFDIDSVLIDEKLHEYILFYNISYKPLRSAKPLRVRFDKIGRFIRVYHGTRYLLLFGAEKYDSINNMIRYLLGVKSGITDVISHNYAKIKVDSYQSSTLEKTLTVHNVTMLINSVFNIDRNNLFLKIT